MEDYESDLLDPSEDENEEKREKHAGGRPSKILNFEIQLKIVQAIRMGMTIDRACEYAGIASQTLLNWKKNAEDETHEHYEACKEFLALLKKSDAESEAVLVGKIFKDETWQSKAWILQRRFKERWGTRPAADAGGLEAIEGLIRAISGIRKEENASSVEEMGSDQSEGAVFDS